MNDAKGTNNRKPKDTTHYAMEIYLNAFPYKSGQSELGQNVATVNEKKRHNNLKDL